MTEPQWTDKGRELMPGIILGWLEQMNEKAEPKLMDTGTIFAEVKVCRFCDQAIERELKLGGAWVHSDGRGMYCHGRRSRPALRGERIDPEQFGEERHQ